MFIINCKFFIKTVLVSGRHLSFRPCSSCCNRKRDTVWIVTLYLFEHLKSCDNLKRQNFVPGFEAVNTAPFMRMRNQCKPDYRLQVARRRYGNTQSVCRQCFSMCSNADATSAKTCFGGLGNKLVFTATATNDEINAAQVNFNILFLWRNTFSYSYTL